MNQNKRFRIMLACFFIAGLLLFLVSLIEIDYQEKLKLLAQEGLTIATISAAFLIYFFRET